MNIFTVELIQVAISFLPFLIAFTLLFSRQLGKYWILPTLAFLLNSGYRFYALYEASDRIHMVSGWEHLLAAFAPSIINVLLFLGLLSIQISLLRNREEQERQPQQLLAGPKEPEPEPHNPSSGTHRRPEQQTKQPQQSSPAEQSPQDEPGKKKVLTPQDNSIDQRISRLHVPADLKKRQEMKEALSEIRSSLEKSLEIAQFNGALKKPRKKKKRQKRKQKTST